jgi:hypothetical protein
MDSDDDPVVAEVGVTAVVGALLEEALPASAMVRVNPNKPMSVNVLLHPIRICMRRSQPLPRLEGSADDHRMLAAEPVMIPCGWLGMSSWGPALAIRV